MISQGDSVSHVWSGSTSLDEGSQNAGHVRDIHTSHARDRKSAGAVLRGDKHRGKAAPVWNSVKVLWNCILLLDLALSGSIDLLCGIFSLPGFKKPKHIID